MWLLKPCTILEKHHEKAINFYLSYAIGRLFWNANAWIGRHNFRKFFEFAEFKSVRQWKRWEITGASADGLGSDLADFDGSSAKRARRQRAELVSVAWHPLKDT
jgi:hypothetical protein